MPMLYCTRCGLEFNWRPASGEPACVHTNTAASILLDEAMRIRARYELGQRFNPDHDMTSYRDGKTTEDECPVGDQLPIEGGLTP